MQSSAIEKKNPTLTKQTKKPAKAHYPFRIKSCKKGNSCIRILCAALYSGSFSPSCMLCKFSHLNTRMELLHQTKQCVWNTSSFFQHRGFLQKACTHVSGLLIPQIFLLHATNTANLLKPANWTSAWTPIIHKHSAWCVGCAVHSSGNNQRKKWI